MKTNTISQHLGSTISIRWGTSRGRDSYGYTTCSLRNSDGKRIAACNGGGYDMRGTVVGHWLTYTFADELRALRAEDMPANSHWQQDRGRECAGKCSDELHEKLMDAIANGGTGEGLELMPLADDCCECPTCGSATRFRRTGRTVDDGRYFYGLTFHDPNFDPSKAVIGKDCTDRTFGPDGENAGKTVAQAEAEGKSVGLERYQAVYAASSKHATARHTVPSIDGACGISSVLAIARAIGIDLRQIHGSAKLDIYEVVAADRKASAA